MPLKIEIIGAENLPLVQIDDKVGKGTCVKARFVCSGIISNNLCMRRKEYESHRSIHGVTEAISTILAYRYILVSKPRNFNFENFEF